MGGRTVIEAMYYIKVEVVRTQSSERTVYLASDGVFGKMPLVVIDFGRNHYLIARDVVLQCLAEILLAGARGISVRGIEEIDAQVESVPYYLFAFLGVQRSGVHFARGIAEAHATQTET